MKDILFKNPKIEVRKSSLHGYGVFANDFIKKGELLEECHWIRMPDSYADGNYGYTEDSKFIVQYLYGWPKISDKEIGNLSAGAINKVVGAFPFGFASIYNSINISSNNIDNADWKTNLETDLFEFWAIIDIKKDEEILIDYSGTIDMHMRTGIIKRERTKPKIFKK